MDKQEIFTMGNRQKIYTSTFETKNCDWIHRKFINNLYIFDKFGWIFATRSKACVSDITPYEHKWKIHVIITYIYSNFYHNI